MLLYGASGHAKVIITCLRAQRGFVTAIFDDDPAKTALWQVPVIGTYDPTHLPTEELIVAIGDNAIRRRIAGQLRHAFGQTIHPSALVDASVQVGEGSVVLQGAILQADARVGRHVIINTGAHVDHDCRLDDFVHVAPGATLCGNVQVGEGTLVGAGSVVAPNLRIGRECVVAAGSVVTTSLPDYATVRGNPARIVKIRQP
ncbi:acetyltransferase [Rhabdobacter roseus]|uniref:Sugar O-acyltransferase (Sialic acid O-acetyltransferase NeuD family) n=1 Tax=Rhabdobacter roseus TaxID=1655419 RepID=A0A840TZ04_9BACT|nr:acetyltransferase [Rhabdobacter roseus]MBB5284859.1 sugar O-acyltransferase (sialic acid O-acetyltransferase NeuD family) [Rhabdobacter roseus]